VGINDRGRIESYGRKQSTRSRRRRREERMKIFLGRGREEEF